MVLHSTKNSENLVTVTNGTEIFWELNVRKANHSTENSGKFWEESRSYGTEILAKEFAKISVYPARLSSFSEISEIAVPFVA